MSGHDVDLVPTSHSSCFCKSQSSLDVQYSGMSIRSSMYSTTAAVTEYRWYECLYLLLRPPPRLLIAPPPRPAPRPRVPPRPGCMLRTSLSLRTNAPFLNLPILGAATSMTLFLCPSGPLRGFPAAAGALTPVARSNMIPFSRASVRRLPSRSRALPSMPLRKDIGIFCCAVSAPFFAPMASSRRSSALTLLRPTSSVDPAEPLVSSRCDSVKRR